MKNEKNRKEWNIDSNPAHSVIDNETRQRYRHQGVVLLKSVFSAERLIALEDAIERALRQRADYFHYRLMWPHDVAFEEFCRQSTATDIAARLMQSDTVSLLFDQVFVKEPGSGIATGWHNDQPYWPIKGNDLISLWIALDPIDSENGAMEFIEGSHHWQRRFAPFYADGEGGFGRYHPEADGQFEPVPDFDSERDQHSILSYDLQPGDVLAFNGMIVHGATANNSHRRRRAYSIRYVGRDACYWPLPASAEFLLDQSMHAGDRFDNERYPVVYRGSDSTHR